jgi:diguanylate cyclase (GGDEF)-like protein
MVRGGQPDALTLFTVMATGGTLFLGVAGWMIGRREDMLADRNAELRTLSEQLKLQTVTDALTQVANRRALDAELSKEVARSDRYKTKLSMVMIDLDHFKDLNDRHGHPAGDEVLKCVARTLERHKRKGDFVARYGGEEFAVLLPHANAEDAAAWAERTRVSLAASVIETNVGSISVTASFGVAAYGPNQATPESITAAADRALYAAKDAGRNQVYPPPSVPILS